MQITKSLNQTTLVLIVSRFMRICFELTLPSGEEERFIAPVPKEIEEAVEKIVE